MTPVSLNPPGPSLQGQTQLFISPNNQDCHTLFNILDPRQTLQIGGELRQNYHQEDDKMVLHDGSSSNHHHQLCNSSLISAESVKEDSISSTCEHNLWLQKMEEEDGKNGHGSSKMMRPSSSSPAPDKALINSTNTNITITTPTSRFQNQGFENRYSQRGPRNNKGNTTTTTRVCSDCNTSTTPLWRSGPKGPKSLCNACGIRQRKARRAMLEGANGLGTPMNNAKSTKTRVHNKEKKSRTNHFAQFKNKLKSTTNIAGSSEGVRKLEYFKDFAIGLRNNSAFPQIDEVAEAALLLMDLSCGFFHL